MSENSTPKKKSRMKGFMQKASKHVITYLAALVLMVLAVHYNMTGADVISSIASINIAVLFMAIAFDYLVDFSSVYKKLERKLPDGAGVGSFVIISAFFAIVFLTAMGYSVTALTGATISSALFVAVLFGVIVAYPKTGTSVFILWIYLAALTVQYVLL